VIISTGTHAALDGIPGLVEAKPLTHVEALELSEVPEHLIVIGAGYVGLELSQAMRRFGSEVSVIGRSDRLLHNEDPDVSDGIRDLFKDEGIDLVNKRRQGGRSQNMEQFVFMRRATLSFSGSLLVMGKPSPQWRRAASRRSG
jgi:pyruvate/2-oxoglutarate dehydrogenase complex dihydrolipoamide dehydrogenase (E3) component